MATRIGWRRGLHCDDDGAGGVCRDGGGDSEDGSGDDGDGVKTKMAWLWRW